MSTQCLRVGVGGPVGSGKTALLRQLCLAMRQHYDLAVVTNDIYTKEDAEFYYAMKLWSPIVFLAWKPVAVRILRFVKMLR